MPSSIELEKSDLPTGGQPLQLAKSVKELWEKMSCYLSFLVKEAWPHSLMAIPAITSKEQAAKEASQKLAKERKCPKFPRWEKVLHPSQPVVVAGQPPCLSRRLEQTYLLMADCNQPRKIVPTETPSPLQELEVAHQWVPTPSFLEVTTYLRGQSPEEVPKAPPVPLAVGMMTAPGVATMSSSHVVQDEATGATYLDLVATSVGRVTHSGPEGKIPAPEPEIEDVTDLV